MQTHSIEFGTYCHQINDKPITYGLKANDIIENIKSNNNTLSYSDMVDLLREVNDAQAGIVSKWNPVQNAWVRDATQCYDLKDRLPLDDPLIEANNALLRCLTRLQPIDFAIGKKWGGTRKNLQAAIKNDFADLTGNILEITQGTKLSPEQKRRAIKAQEKTFNTRLLKNLHEANLTRGCETPQKAKQLLFHLRNLFSVLKPAQPLMTLSYDKKATILQREIQYPVTEKTPNQKEALKHHETDIPLNAFEEIDQLFYERLSDDKTLLPAQARKTHPHTVKNAYVVQVDLVEMDISNLSLDETLLELKKPKTLHLTRSGSPVYVGKGETPENRLSQTKENLEQIRNAVKKHTPIKDEPLLQVVSLVTDSSWENQDVILNNLRQTINEKTKEESISYLPTNFAGCCATVNVSPNITFSNQQHNPHGSSFDLKKNRVTQACTVGLQATNLKKSKISLIHCASGQDRSGTVIEKMIQEWTRKQYTSLDKNPETIEQVRAESGHEAIAASHLVPGSEGMKKDSIAKGLFKEDTTRQLYRPSAGTNKENALDSVDFLKKPCQQAIKDYNDNADGVQNYIYENQKMNTEIGKKLTPILKYVYDIVKAKPERISPSALAQLTTILNSCIQITGNPLTKEKHLLLLTTLAKTLSGHASPARRKLGVALMGLVCLILVTAAVLAAIPSGGSSLLLLAAGSAGLLTSSLAAGGVLATGVVGIGLFASSRQKGLSKAVSEYTELMRPKD